MTTLVCVEILVSRVIVLNLVDPEVVHQVSRWLKISETIEVNDITAILSICNPMCSRSIFVVEVDYR